MIGEIDPCGYDCEGRIAPLSVRLQDEFRSYLTGDLTVKCNSLSDIQSFLRKCRYVSDVEQFGDWDYWMHPRHFERVRRGDCEDFALWTWRQLLAIGIDTRFVMGR